MNAAGLISRLLPINNYRPIDSDQHHYAKLRR